MQCVHFCRRHWDQQEDSLERPTVELESGTVRVSQSGDSCQGSRLELAKMRPSNTLCIYTGVVLVVHIYNPSTSDLEATGSNQQFKASLSYTAELQA